MFLNEVKRIISGTESDLRLQAEKAWKNQAYDLVKSVGIIRNIKLEEILFESDANEYQQGMAGVIYDFEENNRWPSLSALTYATLIRTGINFNSTEAKIMLTAATLGEISNNLSFHSNAHYRKVMMATSHQIAAHNNIYKGTDLELNPREISLLVTAASIHDFMHDGKPNGDDPSRLEKMAFIKAKLFLITAGADDHYLKDLETIILCTDVNPMGSPNAPSNLMKAMYRYHFEGAEKPSLPDSLQGLEDKRLCLLATLFQEADMIPSVAWGYKRGVQENILIAREAGFKPSPNAMYGFLENIFGGFLTKAGLTNQKIYLETKSKFKEDIDNGIEEYPITIPNEAAPTFSSKGKPEIRP